MYDEMITEYLEILEKKDTDKAKEFVAKHFGVEGDEEFKEEEYIEFVNKVAMAVIDRQKEELAVEAEEESKDEADAN